MPLTDLAGNTPLGKAMVNPIPVDPQAGAKLDAPELDENITAKPLVAFDFTNPEPKNPNICFRWVEFKARDGFRFHQCLSQGFAVANVHDVKNANLLKMYEREAGTKFINGDLILMKIDRARYIGAKRHRYLRTVAITDPRAVKPIAQAAAQAMLPRTSKLQAFTPGIQELQDIGFDISKMPGIGGTPGPDIKSGPEIRNEQYQSKTDPTTTKE
jgi:hypothetical protein